jgi:hypothetical protein
MTQYHILQGFSISTITALKFLSYYYISYHFSTGVSSSKSTVLERWLQGMIISQPENPYYNQLHHHDCSKTLLPEDHFQKKPVANFSFLMQLPVQKKQQFTFFLTLQEH